MSKIMLSINLVLSSVIVAWVSVAYFEYKKQRSEDSALPSINLTYSPIPPSFTAEQIQFNASYFVNADTIFAPKLFYLSLPPVSELSDNLLQLNLAAATSKITIENQNISLRAIDLFSPTAPLIGQRCRGDAQSLTTSTATQFSVNIDPPIHVRLSNFAPETMLSSQIPDPSQLNTSAPVTPVAEFPNTKLIKRTYKSGGSSSKRPLFKGIQVQNLRSQLQPPQVIVRPSLEDVEDRFQLRIKIYERMLSRSFHSKQTPMDKQTNFHNVKAPDHKYFIAIGVFAQPSNLDKNINKILSHNLPVTVASSLPGNPRLRQLATGPFIHEAKAIEVLNAIKALGYSDAYLQKVK
jgi:cell division septation protein DedD